MTNSEIIKLFDVSEQTVIDAYNNHSLGTAKVASLNEIDLLIINEKLVLVTHANGDSLYQYDDDSGFVIYRPTN